MLCFTATESCGGVFEQESGTIDYPPGDSNYGYNEFCTWLVILPDPSKRVVVNVTEFNLQNHTSCYLDFLEVSIYTYVPSKFIKIINLEINCLRESS